MYFMREVTHEANRNNQHVTLVVSVSRSKIPLAGGYLGERGLARYTLLWVRCSCAFVSREPVGEASLKLWTRG